MKEMFYFHAVAQRGSFTVVTQDKIHAFCCDCFPEQFVRSVAVREDSHCPLSSSEHAECLTRMPPTTMQDGTFFQDVRQLRLSARSCQHRLTSHRCSSQTALVVQGASGHTPPCACTDYGVVTLPPPSPSSPCPREKGGWSRPPLPSGAALWCWLCGLRGPPARTLWSAFVCPLWRRGPHHPPPGAGRREGGTVALCRV